MRVTQKSKIYKYEVDLFGYLSEIVFKYPTREVKNTFGSAPLQKQYF